MASVSLFNSDPNLQAEAALIEQRKAMAQALLQQGMTPLETGGRQVGGVGYRISPFEGMAKMLQAYMGQKGLQDATKDQAGLAAQAYGALLNKYQPQDPMDASYTPQQVSSASEQSLAGGGGPTNDNVMKMAAALGGQAPGRPAQGVNPNNPIGMPAQLLAAYQAGMIPDEMFKAQAARYKPTEATVQAIQAGQDPMSANRMAMLDPKIKALKQAGFTDAQINAAYRGEAAKAAEIERRPAQQFVNPFLGDSGMVPKLPDNANITGPIGQNGSVPGVTPVPGAMPLTQANSQAGSTGSANGSIINVTNPDGSQVPMRGGAAVGGGMPSPSVSPQPGMPAPSGVAPVASRRFGQSTTDAGIQKATADTIASAPAQVQQSKAAIGGLENALSKLQGIRATGPGTAKTNEVIAVLNNAGIKVDGKGVNDYQSLVKFLNNSLNQAAQGTGSVGSDARFDSFSHGQPSADTMNKASLEGAIRYVLSQHDANAVRGQFIQQAYQDAQRKGVPNAALSAQQAWSKVYDPQVFNFSRMTPEERQQFKASMDPKQQAEFGQKYNFAHSQGWVQ